jgi:MFS family permease
LFTLFGQNVYGRGAAGIGLIWGCAALGLVGGGLLGHYLGTRLTYAGYLHAITLGLAIHGIAYVVFGTGGLVTGCLFVALSRVAVGSINVQNRTMLLKHVPDELRGRVYTTVDAVTQFSMMLSLGVASVATAVFTPREIAVTVGVLSTVVVLPWAWAAATGRLPEPAPQISAKR